MHSQKQYKQPKALYDLFVIELWERFGYYGMQVLLVFFIGDHLKLSTLQTIELNAAFMALVYASPTFGGMLADHFLGIKRTLVLGALLLTFGYFILGIVATDGFVSYFNDSGYYIDALYWSLGCIAIGNGCFKPNPTSLLSKIYEPNDPRIDAGYTIFYMSINIGSLLSMVLTPIIQARYGYSWAFITCGIGLAGGVAYFLSKLSVFSKAGVAADFQPLDMSKIVYTVIMIILLTVFSAYLLAHLFYAKILIFLTVLAVFSMFCYFACTLPKEQANKIIAIFILLLLTAVFFSLQLQMFGVLNIFISQHVDREFMGYIIPPGNYAALNGFWIMVLGPLFAKIYMVCEEKNKPLTIPVRFTAGLLICSTAFYMLSFSHYYTSNGIISSWWIFISYFIISFGELLVSALGLALICKLAPPKFTTLFMGAFLVSIAIGGWISGALAYLIELPENIDNLQSMLVAYNGLFIKIGNLSLAAGVVAAMLVPYMVRLTGEKK